MRLFSDKSNIPKEIFVFIICLLSFVGSYEFLQHSKIQENKEIFISGGILNCGVMVENTKWRLVEDHLINNNLAGHLNLRNCRGVK